LSANFFQNNLISDIPGLAATTDGRFLNPWGITAGPTSPFWISQNNDGSTTIVSGTGTPSATRFTIPIPGDPLGSAGTPTGTVFNIDQADKAFMVSNGTTSAPAIFLFATEDGTILGWNPTVNPVGSDPAKAGSFVTLAVDNSGNNFTEPDPLKQTGAVYKGLAIATDAGGRTLLYAANFRSGKIDVFDTNFKPVTTLPAGAFTDPQLPQGFAPFNVQELDGKIYVTYAKQNDAKHDDVAGPGNGFVDVFNLDGSGGQRLISGGMLDSPWGLAVAPASLGDFAGDVLVGNFGDGHIHAFNPTTGTLVGTMNDPAGNPLTIDGLWGLRFGNNGPAGSADTLFFTAGINEEKDGLFGSLTPATANQEFLARVYQDLLGRSVDVSGQGFWGGMLDQGVAPGQVVQKIEASPEFLTDEVQALYNHLLHRPADPTGLMNDVAFLEAGGTENQLRVQILSSPEYLADRGGGTNAGFVNAAFMDILNRSATGDAGGQALIDALNNQTMTPAQVAAAIVNSLEASLDQVQGFYAQFLHRAADPAGLGGWGGLLQGGASDTVVIAGILGSPEFFNQGP
jgi:uncharacterized protein (TIGR03118 family)